MEIYYELFFPIRIDLLTLTEYRSNAIDQRERELPRLTIRRKTLEREVDDVKAKAESSWSREVLDMMIDS